MGGPKTTTTNKTQQQTGSINPNAQSAGYFPGVYDLGAKAVATNQATPAPQDFVAGPSAGQTSAIDQIYSLAPKLGANAPALSDVAGKVASGYFLDPSNDPTFAGAANAAIHPVTRNLMEQVLPAIIDHSIRTGGVGSGPSAYGGAGQQIAQDKAIQDWTQTAGNITAGMANASRNAGLALIPQAPALAAGANNIALAPAQATGAAGTQERSFAQDALSNLLQRYSTNQQAPWAGLQPFANLLTTGGFKDTSQTTIGQDQSIGPAPDMLTQLLQGITGGAGIAGSLFGAPAGGTSAAGGLASIFGGLGGIGQPINPTGYPVNPWSQFGMFSPANVG